MKEKINLPKKSAQVPGQYAGYSLQATRFLYRLLQATSGDTVSLEVFDDIGIEKSDGLKTAEQSKSTHNGNPISNRSKELWKTLGNWIASVKSGQLDVSKTYFEMYVSRQVAGGIADSFSLAKTDKEVKDAYLKARSLLWGVAPEYSEKSKLIRFPERDYAIASCHAVIKYSNDVIELIAALLKLFNPCVTN